MEALKAIAAVLLITSLCGCGTPDKGYKRQDPSYGSFSRIQEIRRLLLLPPGFQLVEGMESDRGSGLNCAGPEEKKRITQQIEEAIVLRMTDWKDYVVIRPEYQDIEARTTLAKLCEQLAANAENHPFPKVVPDGVQEKFKELGRRYNTDGIIVFTAREVSLSAGIFSKMLAISLPTLGIGGMTYVFSVIGPFSEAAIYDNDGHLQWWYRGQINGSWCSKDVTSEVSAILDSLPNAKPAALSTPH